MNSQIIFPEASDLQRLLYAKLFLALLWQLLGLLLTGSERAAIPFKKGMLAIVDIESSATMTGRLIAAMSQRIAAGL